MKPVLFLCILLFLTGVRSLDDYSVIKQNKRALLESASVTTSASATSKGGGSASTSASGTSTGGVVEVVSTATSESFTKVGNKLVTFFRYVFEHVEGKPKSKGKAKYCKEAYALIKKKLKAVASVTAEAYAEAMSTIQIKGKGHACAQSEATSSSQAAGFSKILADAIAEASSKYSTVEAQATVEVISTVIAKAFAKSFAKACLQDEGEVIALQVTFARAVIKPVASVSIYAAAKVDCGGEKGFSSTDVKGKSGTTGESTTATSESTSETTGEGTSETGGSASASAKQLDRCAGKYQYCCSRRWDDGECKCLQIGSKKCDAKLVKGKVDYWEEGDMQCVCDKEYYYSMKVQV
eukprot:g4719.t1